MSEETFKQNIVGGKNCPDAAFDESRGPQRHFKSGEDFGAG